MIIQCLISMFFYNKLYLGIKSVNYNIFQTAFVMQKVVKR